MSAQPATTSTDLAPVEHKALTLQQRAMVALGERDEAALQKLADGTKDIVTITNTAGYQQVHAARMVLKNKRISIEKDAKKARQDAVDFGKAVIAEEGRLIAIVADEEKRLQTLQDAWDAEQDRIRQEKAEAERKRVAALQSRVDEIRQYPLNIVGTDSANIEGIIKTVVELVIDDSYAELKQQAEGARATTLIRLRAALANALSMEAEQARLTAERAENERVRLANEAAAKAERERLAEVERVAREALEKEDAELRKAAELNRMRMSEIQGIQQQVIIAQCGRLGVREGGTIECIRETLAETEKWPIKESTFGPMTGIAQAAKDRALTVIGELLAKAETKAAEVIAAAAERQRLADEAEALQTRIDAQKAEAERIADAQKQLERDQAALRAEREKPAADAAPLPLSEPVALPDVAVIIGGESIPSTLETTAEADPLLMTIRLTEYLAMESVCKFAKEWAAFQERDSKLDQKTDRKLAQQARAAEANLLAVVEQLP